MRPPIPQLDADRFLAGDIEPRRRSRGLMAGTLIALVIAAGLGFALFSGAISVAQQNPPVPQPAPRGQAPAAAPAAPSAPAAPAGQAEVTRQQDFGDWRLACTRAAQGGPSQCSIMQQLARADSRAAVFVWRIAKDGDGGLVSIWQTPDGVLLTRGVTMEAGTPKPITIPFETCSRGRCQATAKLAPDFVETLSKAQKLTATIVMLDRRPVTLPLSAKGLAEGLSALAGS